MSEAKIAALKEEIESIRFADALYWKRGKDYSREASTEYQRRQNRLPEIRSALALLENAARKELCKELKEMVRLPVRFNRPQNLPLATPKLPHEF